MQQLDRINPPKSAALDNILLRPLSSIQLSNGSPLYYLNTPNTAVLKIDFVFNAGLRNQVVPGQASTTSAMLSEGTSVYTAKQLADNLDQFGAYLQAKVNTEDAVLTLYCLPKFLEQCIPLVLAVLTDCSFPEKELSTYKTNSIQRFLINSQRNNFLGRRAFYSSVFGNNNAYGNAVNQEDYENISRETVLQFYEANYKTGFKYMMVSGEVSGAVLAKLESGFGSTFRKPSSLSHIVLPPTKTETIFIENNYSVQSSIKIGKRFVNRNNPNFNKLQVLNLALGGYFGSRLMKNIREEKGLTYGIFSAMESYLEAGAFYIETEINNDLREKGVKEIGHEIEKLRTEPIPQDELELVKNYMLGSFLRGVDGPFSLMDRYKMILDYGFSNEYYQSFVDTVKGISARDLLLLAQEYLDKDSLTTVIVGKK